MPLNLRKELIDLGNLTLLLKKENYMDVPLIKVYDQALKLLQNSEWGRSF